MSAFDVSDAYFEPTTETRPESGQVYDGLSALLDAAVQFLRRYVVLTDDQAVAIALWIAHTHAFDAAHATAYLSITSAEKRSGKTRLLEVLELLVASAWLTGRH